MCAGRVLFRCSILAVAGGLLWLSWQQWRFGAVFRQAQFPPIVYMGSPHPPPINELISRARSEEVSAVTILSHTGTETSLSRILQSITHLQQAQALSRQAVLRRPLCTDCQHRLARVIALSALLSPSWKGSVHPGFQRSLSLAPGRADLWEETGRFLLSVWPAVGEADRRFAVTCLERALALAPQRTEAILAAAFVADPTLPGVVSGTDPRRSFVAARLYQRYGDTVQARRQAQKAEAWLRAELSQEADDFPSLLLLGEVRLFLGDQENAREAYADGCARAGDLLARREFCWRLATWHFERQDYLTAKEYYRLCLTFTPESPEAVLLIGLSTLRAGDRVGGVQWLERAAGMRPRDAGWQAQLAGAFEEAGRYDRANALYRRLLAQGTLPRSDLLQRLARNYKQLGLGREALATYQHLLELDAVNAEARAFIELVKGQAKKD